jgi:hypothetical protein
MSGSRVYNSPRLGYPVGMERDRQAPNSGVGQLVGREALVLKI